MKINVKIRDEKLQYDINREGAKISSSKVDKYEHLTVKQIVRPDQSRMIEQTKFSYSPLGKFFEKQIKTTEDQERKQNEVLIILKPGEQISSIKDTVPKDRLNEEAKNEIEKKNM